MSPGVLLGAEIHSHSKLGKNSWYGGKQGSRDLKLNSASRGLNSRAFYAYVRLVAYYFGHFSLQIYGIKLIDI